MVEKRAHLFRFLVVCLLLICSGNVCMAKVPAEMRIHSTTYLSKYADLSTGSTGEDVLALEERLSELGFDVGLCDGVYDTFTLLAVSAFQTGASLPSTGTADALTQYALFQEIIPEELTHAVEDIKKYAPLAAGSQGECVEKLEERLIQLGYLASSADELYDTDTTRAVSNFQRDAALEETGVAGSLTQYMLFESSTPSTQFDASLSISQFPPLSVGSLGEGVLTLEKRLAELCYDPGTVDGVYDTFTALAVSAFQRAASLPDTGDAGSLTQLTLYQASAPTPTPSPVPTLTPQPSATMLPVTEAAYIGNQNSMKFHVPTCTSVAKMDDVNKVPLSSREEALAAGYTPCKRCNP